MDDVPIGGGAGDKMMNAPSSSDQADNSGPLEKRIISKNWKTRADAYDELATLCDNSKIDSKEPFFSEYSIMWKEILKDSNPGALEKALACLEKFLQKCRSAVILDYQNGIINSLIEKCFGHAKPVIKTKAIECFLLLFECSENFEISIDALIALATNKNQKVLIGGTQAIALLVENFGVKKLKIQLFAETMLKNAQNATPDVKKAAYDYYKAVYKWIGEVIVPQISDKLKPQQMEELQKLFDEIKAKGNKDKRVVRSEKAKEEEAKKNALIDAAIAEENKGVEEVIDPLEFAPEVDILAQFGVEWQESTAAIKKWDEKVQKLTDLINASKNKKIKPGNFENLSQFLKKEINASHVSINASAIEASTVLANGLKKDFQPYIKHLMSSVLLKFKEKKQVIIDRIGSFLDAALLCTDLEQIKDDIIMGLTNAAPLVKQGTIKFVDKAAIITYIDVLQRIADDIMPAMIKAIDDKDSGVRDVALHCFGILKGRYGDSIMAKYMKGIDVKQKLEKIDEAQKEIKPSKYDRAENWKPPPPKKVVEKKKADDEDELMNFDQKPKKVPPKKAAQKPAQKDDEDQIMSSQQKDEDDLMQFDVKPKKAPPKNIGQKPKKTEDEEMKNEENPPPPPKKAPPVSAKPKTQAVSSSSKPPSAPVIEDEDLGQGLSKEEAQEKVSEFFNSSTVDLFDKDKWQDKKTGFEELEKEIIEKQPSPVILEAVAKFVKAKMKDWKESNINLQKAIVSIFDCIVKNSEKINKRTVQCAMSYFIDKIGDVKMQESIKTMLMTAAELVTPKFICLQVIKYAATAKSPNNLTQSCVFLTDIIEDFGVGGIPLKETIDYGKIATAHATPAVRQSAMKMYSSIYRQVGDVIKNFLNDIKESTLKMIYDEFEKLTVYKKGEFQKKRNVRGEAAEQEEAQIGGKKGKAGNSDDLLASLPREDISKKLNAKLMEQFKNKDWKIRKKGGDDVEAILREAKMRIEPNGLNELMENIKNLMKDPNKAVVKVFIALLGLLAEAIGNPIKQYIKKCFVPMLNNLSDKQSLVRQDVIQTMNKWAEAIGADQIINQISPILIIENPEFRTESLNWILQNTSSLQSCDHQSLIKPLISCLLDKSKEIRSKTEEIISLVMPILGYQEFLNATKDQKPAVQQTLKPILEKIKSQCNAGQGPALNSGTVQKENDDLKATKIDGKDGKKQIFQTQPIKIEKKEELIQPVVIGSFQKKAEERKNLENKGALTSRDSNAAIKQVQKGNADDDEVKINPINKSKRAQQDAKSKYPINEVKGDHIERLQSCCNDIFGLKFTDQMFAKSQDFEKHIKCAEILDKLVQTQYEQMTEVLDIIFKWGVLRMNESSNTKLLISIFDFYANLINSLIENQYKMQEFEMIILVSTLCDKVGHNIQIMKDKSRKLLKQCFDFYDKKGCYRLIVDNGVKSKNLKVVSECLEEIADFIVSNGIDSISKKDYELYLKTLDTADKSVRESTLRVFGEIYTILGEEIWKQLSKDMPPKVKSLLEARFKTVGKKAGAVPSNLNSSLKSNGQNNSGMKQKLQNTLNITDNSQSKKKALQNSIGSLQFKKPAGNNKLDHSMKSDNQISGGSIPDEQPQESMSLTQKIEPRTEMKAKQNLLSPINQEERLQDIFQGKLKLQNDSNRNDAEMIDEKQIQEDLEAKIIKNKARLNQDISDNYPQSNKKMNTINLDQALNDAENKLELDVEPELKKQKQFILNHINQLKNGDLLKRVDSLVALNEVISGLGNQNQGDPQNNNESQYQQKALIKCCDDLIHAFSQVMNDIFSYPVQEIPLRFTKYFITIVNKTCSQKEIMREVSYEQVSSLVEQLLTRLLIDNLDKIGSNKEGELILKNLNSSMLRMLENCSHTYIFVVLFELLTKYKDDMSNQKVPSLIIKCLLKLSKNMEKIIDKIDLKKFLVAIHEYLASIGQNRSNNDDLGMRITKTLINEIVKLKKDAIWKYFEVIEKHEKPDLHLKKWIQIILRSLQEGIRPSISNQNQNQNQQVSNQNDQNQPEKVPQSRMYVEFEIKKIIQDLNDSSKYENAIQRLDKFQKSNPQYDFTKNLLKESNEFAQQVKLDLNKFRNGVSNISTNSTSGGLINNQATHPQEMQLQRKLNNIQSTQNLQGVFHQSRMSNAQQIQSTQDLNSSLNKQSAFQSKMAQFTKRQSTMGGMPPQNTQTLSMSNQGQSQQQVINNNQSNLNTSFSDLNQKLSNQWANIQNSNKKTGQFTGRPTVTQNSTNQLAQTINIGSGGIRNSAFIAQNSQNQLNTSNNQFKNRLMQGNLANRLQQKVNNNDSLGAQGEETGIIGQKAQIAQEDDNNKVQLNRSSNVVNNQGGISNNSFRSRLVGLKQTNTSNQNDQSQNQPSSQQAVTSINLQQRLAEMKQKLQGLKNN